MTKAFEPYLVARNELKDTSASVSNRIKVHTLRHLHVVRHGVSSLTSTSAYEAAFHSTLKPAYKRTNHRANWTHQAQDRIARIGNLQRLMSSDAFDNPHLARAVRDAAGMSAALDSAGFSDDSDSLSGALGALDMIAFDKSAYKQRTRV